MMAILHTLLNINDSTILGSRLSGYKDFFAGVSSDIRGESIASQADLLEINNSYDMFHPVQNIAAQSPPAARPPSAHGRRWAGP